MRMADYFTGQRVSEILAGGLLAALCATVIEDREGIRLVNLGAREARGHRGSRRDVEHFEGHFVRARGADEWRLLPRAFLRR